MCHCSRSRREDRGATRWRRIDQPGYSPSTRYQCYDWTRQPSSDAHISISADLLDRWFKAQNISPSIQCIHTYMRAPVVRDDGWWRRWWFLGRSCSPRPCSRPVRTSCPSPKRPFSGKLVRLIPVNAPFLCAGQTCMDCSLTVQQSSI